MIDIKEIVIAINQVKKDAYDKGFREGHAQGLFTGQMKALDKAEKIIKEEFEG